jgi:hypothetical protein
VIDEALAELESNRDVRITTRREDVIGLLVKRCLEAGDGPVVRAKTAQSDRGSLPSS